MDRRHKRFATAIPVTISTVLTAVEATIVNLSAGGAQVAGPSLPERSRCQIDYAGQTVYATVMWAEPDRMGLSFPYELREGPLFDQLERHEEDAEQTLSLAREQMIRRTAVFGRRIAG